MTASLLGKKSVVLGANGYLGRHLVHYLTAAGGLTHACGAQLDAAVPGTAYSRIDVSDPLSLQSLDWAVDYVYIFAGITGTYFGFDQFERFVQVNELGLLNILTAILKSNHRPRIIFPSTRLVYAGSDTPLTEADPKQAKTIYAINKLACENILQCYYNAFDLPFTVFRICVPYGNVVGSGYSYGLTGAFIKQARENSAITLFGDGSLRRTLTHVEDICRDIIAASADPRTVAEIFNIPGEAFSLKEVAMLIGDRYAASVRMAEWPAGDLKIESGHTVFDGSKLQQLCGMRTRHRFETWVRQAPAL